MEKKIKILGLIPARGGSKGVPRKNIKLLLGMSLLERSINVAIESGQIESIVVSSDDTQIITKAKALGADVPFVRPPLLASDSAAMIDVIKHTIAFYESKGEYFDALLLLQPTSPLRTSRHIIDAIALLKDNDSVCSVVEIPADMRPHYLMKITDQGYLDNFLNEGKHIKRRQDAPPAFKREGTIYLTKIATILKYNNLYGTKCQPMLIAQKESLSIDTPEDWKQAIERLKLRDSIENLRTRF